LDRAEISSGEALAGIVREGRAGSNTTADHISVLAMALDALPDAARPKKGDPEGPRLLVRADAAGATHGFAAFCRTRDVAFYFGFAIDKDVRDAIVSLEESAFIEATEDDGEVRDGAWVAEITDGLDLSAWPEGSRVIVRKERPHPGAQLSLFDEIEGLRHTAFICAERTAGETSALSIARLEVRQRTHARVEDRIRQAKAAGLRNLPCKQVPENHAWLECVLAALDLVACVQAHLLFRRARPRPLRDRCLSLPHLAHGRPHHPGRSRRAVTPRSHLGLGPTTRARLYPDACGVRLRRPQLCVDTTPTPSGSNYPPGS
jgi:hypothetical protein